MITFFAIFFMMMSAATLGATIGIIIRDRDYWKNAGK